MGCVCCSVGSFVSILLDALERVSMCTVCAALTCCLLFTILIVLVMGIGIGFHYCFVSNSVEGMARAAKAAGAERSDTVMRSVDKAVRRGFAHRVARRDAVDANPANTIGAAKVAAFQAPTGVVNPKSDVQAIRITRSNTSLPSAVTASKLVYSPAPVVAAIPSNSITRLSAKKQEPVFLEPLNKYALIKKFSSVSYILFY